MKTVRCIAEPRDSEVQLTASLASVERLKMVKAGRNKPDCAALKMTDKLLSVQSPL